MPPKQGNFKFFSLQNSVLTENPAGDEKLCFFPHYTLDISLISFQGNDLGIISLGNTKVPAPPISLRKNATAQRRGHKIKRRLVTEDEPPLLDST